MNHLRFITLFLFIGLSVKLPASATAPKPLRPVTVSFVASSFLGSRHFKELDVRYQFKNKLIPSVYLGVGYNNWEQINPDFIYHPYPVATQKTTSLYQLAGLSQLVFSKDNFKILAGCYGLKFSATSITTEDVQMRNAPYYAATYNEKGQVYGVTLDFEYSFYNRITLQAGLRPSLLEYRDRTIYNPSRWDGYDNVSEFAFIPFENIHSKSNFIKFTYLKLAVKL